MKPNNWNILIAQLAVNGLMIKNDTVFDYSLKHKCSIHQKISMTKKSIQKTQSAFQTIWCKMQDSIMKMPVGPHNFNKIDENRKLLFINSVNKLCLMAQSFGLNKTVIDSISRKDIYDVAETIILQLPDILMSLDVLLRKMSKSRYILKLLRCCLFGQNKVNSMLMKKAGVCVWIKTANGVSGPYSNLDLPMKQRQYLWSDIQQQFGNQKKSQYRYRKGFDAYNSQKVGEGHHWIEQRNQPFLWSDRATQDPYPSRTVLSN